MITSDWRTWVFQTLTDDAALSALLPQLPDGDPAIYGSGALLEPPEYRPFLIVRMGIAVPGPFPGVGSCRVRLYAHDEPGDYLRLGDALQAAKRALIGSGGHSAQVPLPGATACTWVGDGEDLSDPDFGTIYRTSDYDLTGKR